MIGVDTHKEFHVAVALAPNGGLLGECSIPANRQDYSDLQDWALDLGSRAVFVVEGTGSFGAGLCRELMASGFSVGEINRPDRSTRHRLGKDDAFDAEAAGRFFLAGTAKSQNRTPASWLAQRQQVYSLSCNRCIRSSSRCPIL